ncbi:MAG: TIM barrel protein [Rhodothermales bacterium]
MDRRSFLTSVAAAGAAMRAAKVRAEDIPRRRREGHRDRRAGSDSADGPICVFSKHLQFLAYDAMAQTAAEIGFDGVDLTVRPGGHVLPEHVDRDLPRAVAAVRQAGLQVPMMTTAIATVDDPYAETVLRKAADLGIRHYRMNWVRYEDDRGVRAAIEAYRPKLERLAALNEDLGLHGGYQNHAGRLIGAPVWDLDLLFDGLDPRYVGSQYDIRHATVEGANTWPLGLRLIAPYVRTTVIKDFEWEKRDGRWTVKNVPLGDGMVEFEAYFELVRYLGISGPISLHFEYELPEHQDIARRTRETAKLMRRDLDRLRTYMQTAESE